MRLNFFVLACTLALITACGGVEGDDLDTDTAAATTGGAAAPSTARRNGTTTQDIAGSNVCKFGDGTSLVCCAQGTTDWYYLNNRCAFCDEHDCHDYSGRYGDTTRTAGAR